MTAHCITRFIPIVVFAIITSCGEQEQRPDILFVGIDTLRADHMSLYGYERGTTPLTDSFGRRYTYSTQAH